MLLRRPGARTTQDGLSQPLARRPQLHAVGRALSKTPQLVIPAKASRVREGDLALELVEWI
ncbi:uncharacterized protein BDR25DRAFT_301891, partial [Lindgomyces ingoldianus]